MEKKKILFISQEITPYVAENEMSNIGRFLPQGIQERGKEIRSFMPRFGTISERRCQLHEVIRLSGMNLIIDDTDHSLIIKVASIQTARMQVYFIDNDDYFQRKQAVKDKEGNYFADNDERMIFFGRGVLETVKKLRWAPDIVHCQGWITALVPIYLKRSYKDDPLFSGAKVIYTVYDDAFTNTFADNFKTKLKLDNITDKDVKNLITPDFETVSKFAIDYSDAVVKGSPKINSAVESYIDTCNKPVLNFPSENYIETYDNFYDKILSGK